MAAEPLSMRLYFKPPYFELARLIGWLGLPADEAREKVKPLEEKHGRDVMVAAANELVTVDDKTQRAVLTPAARKFCRQLLEPGNDRDFRRLGECPYRF